MLIITCGDKCPEVLTTVICVVLMDLQKIGNILIIKIQLFE